MYKKELKDKKKFRIIDFEVHDYSSFASNYCPNNIKIDDPSDPNSRWSTMSNDHRQFIILRTDPCLLTTISFGKFSKIHVCNVKEMKISVSYDNISYTEVFYGGLQNDTDPETFCLKVYADDSYIVTRFVKIEPLAAWGMNFNYSFWYIELRGLLDVKDVLESNKIIEDKKALEFCLKTLKKFNFMEEHNKILKMTGSAIENENLRKIIKYMEAKEYEELDNFIDTLDGSLFDAYLKNSGYFCRWEEIKKNQDWPCERGGHQMVAINDIIYLYGGWNGFEELGDMWIYDKKVWKCINPETLSSTGPGKRSCHKMTTDGERIFLIGKYVSNISREDKKNDSDIWIFEEYWHILDCDNKERFSNVYDHSLVYGDKSLYMFGGKFTDKEDSYGGLYKIDLLDMYDAQDNNNSSKVKSIMDERYNLTYRVSNKNPRKVLSLESNNRIPLKTVAEVIKDNAKKSMRDIVLSDTIDGSISKIFYPKRWYILREDLVQEFGTPAVKGRVGHSMIHIKKDYIEDCYYNNSIVIIGGQRGKEVFKNMLFYSLDTDTVYEAVYFPIKTDGRVIHRSILFNNNILILFTHSSEGGFHLNTFSLYTYSLTGRIWNEVKVVKNTPTPLARSAHQFVALNDEFYLFGGNIIDKTDKRQNDLWRLKLHKEDREDVRKMMKMVVHKYKFLLLLNAGDQIGAIDILRKYIKPGIFNEESKELFVKACFEIFERGDISDPFDDMARYLGVKKEYKIF